MLKRIFTAFLVFLIMSCGGKNISKNDVELFMIEYFEKTKKNDFVLIEPYYSNVFYKTTNRAKWEESFYKLHTILGELISFELVSWNIKAEATTSGFGKHYTFVYNNKYENGNVSETINIFIPSGEKEIKIYGHNYTSDVFLGL